MNDPKEQEISSSTMDKETREWLALGLTPSEILAMRAKKAGDTAVVDFWTKPISQL